MNNNELLIFYLKKEDLVNANEIIKRGASIYFSNPNQIFYHCSKKTIDWVLVHDQIYQKSMIDLTDSRN